jgi:putative hydrolase of the HAD superfamily
VIEAVLFDWGGTLSPIHEVDLIDAWLAAAQVLAPEDADRLAALLLAGERDRWQQTEGSMTSFTTEQVIRTVCEAAGVELGSGCDAACTAYHRYWTPYLPARPEAVGVIRELRESGLRTGLLSNTHWPRAIHEEVLAADGLLDLLDARVYTSDLPYMKPHGEAFRALLDAVGVSAENAVFVGDRLHDDVHGAQQAGMRAVWIRNDAMPPYDVHPDLVIDALTDLPQMVKEL